MIHHAGEPFVPHASTQERWQVLLTGKERRLGDIPLAPSSVFQVAWELPMGSEEQVWATFQMQAPQLYGSPGPRLSQEGQQ